MDTDKEQSIIVRLNQERVKISQLPGGLYACNPKLNQVGKQDKLKFNNQSYLSVTENSKFISNKHLQKVQDVKGLHNALGIPSYADLKAIIKINRIKNNKITHKDTNLAERIFGKSSGEIKNKTVRQNSKLQQYDIIVIPEELIQKNKDQELIIDTM